MKAETAGTYQSSTLLSANSRKRFHASMAACRIEAALMPSRDGDGTTDGVGLASTLITLL